MKIKFNWGWGIAIFFSIFILFLAFNLIFAALQKNDLVVEDYYKKELEYQSHIDNVARTKKLNERVKITVNSSVIIIEFPKEFASGSINGKANLYRPSNNKLDKTIEIKANDANIMVVDVRNYQKGRWKLKLDWNANGNNYYDEEIIDL